MRRGMVPALITMLLATGCSDRLETRTFPLENVSMEAMYPLVQPYVISKGSTVSGTEQFPSIIVRERPEVLERIGEIIAEHDKPQSTVTLHFQIIEADGFTTTDPAIADVEGVLRRLFRFSGYRLVTEAVMANVTPMLDVPPKRESWADYQLNQRLQGGEYSIYTDVRSVSGGESGVATADLAVMLLYRGSERLLETSVRVPNGQTVVLGNAMGPAGDNTIILTLRPEIP